jgi:AcrR family transcriptional regulator
MNPDSATEKPVRLRDRLRDEANRAILAAAEEVFSEEGLTARMERIAARAGVAVGTLYNHFQDRQALAAALATSRRAVLLARLDGALAASEGWPVREQLRALLGAVAEHAAAHGRYLSMLVQAGEGPARTNAGCSVLDELVARADQVVERGVAAGELRPEGKDLFGIAFIGMIRAVNLRALAGGPGWAEQTDQLVDLFLRGAQR